MRNVAGQSRLKLADQIVAKFEAKKKGRQRQAAIPEESPQEEKVKKPTRLNVLKRKFDSSEG